MFGEKGLEADVLATWTVRESVAVIAELDFSAEEAIERKDDSRKKAKTPSIARDVAITPPAKKIYSEYLGPETGCFIVAFICRAEGERLENHDQRCEAHWSVAEKYSDT